MTLSFSCRLLPFAALLGVASLAHAQSQPVSPLPPPNVETKTTVIVTGPGAEPVAAKPVSTKPCPIPTGSRIRPQRDASGRCPPESEEDVDLDTNISGQIGSTAGLIRNQGN